MREWLLGLLIFGSFRHVFHFATPYPRWNYLIKSAVAPGEDFFSAFKISFQLQLPVVHWYQGYNRLSYTRVEIEDVSIQDDEKLFKDINEMYAQNRGWLRRHFSIWRLERLEIVRV